VPRRHRAAPRSGLQHAGGFKLSYDLFRTTRSSQRLDDGNRFSAIRQDHLVAGLDGFDRPRESLVGLAEPDP
jgi:hypothetical protein